MTTPQSEQELDIQALCGWVHDTHRPDQDLVCTECGQQWWIDPNIGPVQCDAHLTTRIEANFAVMRRVWRLRAKWRTRQ